MVLFLVLLSVLIRSIVSWLSMKENSNPLMKTQQYCVICWSNGGLDLGAMARMCQCPSLACDSWMFAFRGFRFAGVGISQLLSNDFVGRSVTISSSHT